MSQRHPFDCPLYYLLNLPTERPLLELASEVIEGGVDAIQLRAKDCTAAELYEAAAALRPVTREAGVSLIINDRLDVALAVEADGVHLGKEDLPLSVARSLAPQLVIGISCYGDVERAREAIEGGADYIAFGAFYASPTKPQAPTISLDVLREARGVEVPIVTIGGITNDKIPELIAAGADSVAIISAIQQAESPKEAAATLKATLHESIAARQ